MDFWNEYEGKTIAGSFPLEKLLYPEGRNGFFSTFNGTGAQAVIRLTESLNDQEEMLEQWSIVRGLEHPNLMIIKKFGQTVVDEVPLTYAVMEPPDASLAEILLERPMTAEETTQIAAALAAALEALHGAGLIHGHIEPAGVFAVGETVKLRSDCVRRAADEFDTRKLQAQDVKDFAALLLEAFSPRAYRAARPATAPHLPAPLEQIVRNGMSGSWGLKEISAALGTIAPRADASAPAVAASAEQGVPAAAVPIARLADNRVDDDRIATNRVDDKPLGSIREKSPLGPSPSAALGSAPPELAVGWMRGAWPWIGAALLILALVLAWRVLHRAPQATTSPSQLSSSAAAPAPISSPAPAVGGTSPQSAAPASASAVDIASSTSIGSKAAAASVRDVWRVVAFTYNRQQQAQQKVDSIRRTHNALAPEVFTPTGHAPYLVTLGGAMTREEASALERKAKSEGFPRDTYAQNYAAR